MNQGIFTLLFPSKPKQTSENCSVPIYVDTSFTSKIKIEIKQNMLISDIFKFIHEDDDKQNLYLVLIHYSVQRRLQDYEKVEDVLHNNNSKFVIYDFQKKQQIQGQKYPKYFEKIKLSCLDKVRLYNWQNNTKFDFQIENESKLYFFQALKETDFDYWLRTIQESLNAATYKSLLYEMDIKNSLKIHFNKFKLMEDIQNNQKSQITDICDVNILEFLLTKNKDFIREIRKQIEKDTYCLVKPLESQSQVEPLRIFTQRYHSLIKKDCDLDQIIEDLNDEITSAYLGFLKIQKIRTKIIQQARVQFKEQFSQFNPSFDQFYN
ncbi:unnamed protein product [Paramecium primaurelia]|uniref:PH domain-containing protein n=1 Tax=Paramecium primaurelia TaxID=5886 RepID=A0A8S1L4X9_PARPR|nr:unnamed protein product [Paramecium primaurelia]